MPPVRVFPGIEPLVVYRILELPPEDAMEYIRTASRQFVTGERLTVNIEGRAGDVIVEGQDSDRVTVQVVARLAGESGKGADGALERILDAIRWDGESLTIEAPNIASQGPWFLFGRGAKIDYAVVVPRGAKARVLGRSGRISVTGVLGPVDIDQRSGRTSVRNIGGEVTVASQSGPVEIERVGGKVTVVARSGRITLRDVESDVKLNTNSGSIEAERAGAALEAVAQSGNIAIDDVEGSVRAVAQSGRVTVSGVGGQAQIDARTGVVTVANVRNGAKVRTHSGNVMVRGEMTGGLDIQSVSGSVTVRGSVRGNLDIQAASGQVRLDVDPEAPFFIDAESTSGAIHSELTPRLEAPSLNGEGPRVKVRTSSGNIRVNRFNGA